MEGGGETVVAVIQELKDSGISGLAVAVVGGTRVQHSQKLRKKVPVTKSSVQTNTEIAKRTAYAQISDGHYTSSYQLAHCHVCPSSPPLNLPEFPVQRRAPSRIKGNFKPVGCFGCGEMSTSTGFRQQRRRDFNSRIGEYHQSPSRSLASDSFVDSLRKYPLPGGRSASTELVQRLLNYTQAKHSTNISSRSARSLTNRPSRKTKRKSFYKQPGRASKNIQTYTRTVNETPSLNSRNKRNRKDSPITDHLSETYNYLKAALSGIRSYNGNSPEIRYLNEVKNYIKNTIRQLTDQPAMCCPTVQCRYDEHRRRHHKTYTDSTTSPISNESEGNPGPPRDTPTASDCKRNSFCIDTPSSIAVCPDMLGRYRNHRKVLHGEDADDNVNEAVGTQADPPTAACYNRNDFGISTTSSLTICPYALSRYRNHRRQFHRDDVNEAVGIQVGGKSICVPPPQTKRSCSFLRPCSCSKREMAVKSKERQTDVAKKLTDGDIERNVTDWLMGLPAYVNSSPENQKRYRKMANDLGNRLKDIFKGENGDDKAMKEILDCLNKLPADEIDPDEIKKVVSEWLENFHFNKSDKDLLETIVNSLLPILKNGTNKDELKQQIVKMLPEPEPDEVENLVEQLYNIVERHKNKSGERSTSMISRQPVSDWLDTLDSVPKELKEEIQREAKQIDNNLNQFFFQEASDESIANEINKFLDILPKEEIPLSTEQKKKLTSNFINSIRSPNILKSMTETEKKTIARNLLSNLKTKPKPMSVNDQKESSDKFQNISNIPKDIKVKNEGIFNNFEKKLQQLKSRNASKDIINTEISDFLRNLPEQGIHLTQSEQSQLANNLFSQATSKENKVSNPTELWLENLPNVSEEIKMKNRDLVKDFDAKLQQLKSEDASDDELESKISVFINSLPEKGIIISPEQQFELTKKLKSKQLDTSKPDNISASDWLENEPNISEDTKRKNKPSFKKIDNKLQQLKSDNADDDVVQEEVNNFLKSLPGKGIKLSPSQKSQLSDNLTKQTNPLQSANAEYWLKKAPNIPEETKRRNKMLFKNFDKTLQELKSDNADDEVIEEEVNNFLSSLPGKGIKLSPSQKSQLSDNLTKQTNPLQSDNAENWLKNAPNISEETKRKNKMLFKKLDDRLQQLTANNADDDVIQEEVNNFLSSLPEKGIKLTPSQKNELSGNLISQINSLQSDKAESWSENEPNVSEETKRENKLLFKNFDNKLQQLKANNGDDDVIQEEVNNFLSSLPGKGIKLTPLQKSQLSDNLTKQTNPLQSDNAEDWLKKAPNIPEETKRRNKMLFKNFDKKLQELKSDNADDDVIEEEVNNFLSSLPGKGIKLSPSQKSQLSDNLTNPVNAKSNRILLDNAEDWLENAPNISEEAKRKNKILAENFDKKIRQLKSQNADYDNLAEEINKFVNALRSRGISLTPALQKQLTKTVIGKNTKSDSTSSHSTENWVDDKSKIYGDRKKNNKIFGKSKSRQSSYRNYGFDVGDDKINECVETLRKKGITLTPSQFSNLANNLKKESIDKPNPGNSRPVENWFENEPAIQHTKNNIRNKSQPSNASKRSKALCDYEEPKAYDDFDQSSQRGQHRVNNQLKQKTSKTSNLSSEREENSPENTQRFSNNLKREDRKFNKKNKSDIFGGEDYDGELEIELYLPEKRNSISISPKKISQQGIDISKYGTPKRYQRYKKTGPEQYKEDEIIPEEIKIKPRNKKSQQTNTQRVDDDVTESEVEDLLKSKRRITSSPSQTSQFDMLDMNKCVKNCKETFKEILEKAKNQSVFGNGDDRFIRNKPKNQEIITGDVSRLQNHDSPYSIEDTILSTLADEKARGISDNEIKRQIIRKLKKNGFSDSEAAKLATKIINKNKNISPISSDYKLSVSSSKQYRTQRSPERAESKRPLNRSDFITSTPRKSNGRFIPKNEGQISTINYDSDEISNVEKARMSSPKSKLKSKFDDINVIDNDNARKRKSKDISKEIAVDDDDDENKHSESDNARKRTSKYRSPKYNSDDDEDVDIDYARKRKSKYKPIENNEDDLDVDIDYARQRNSKYKPTKYNDDHDKNVDINYARKRKPQYKLIEGNDDYDLNADVNYERKRNSRYKSTEINDNHYKTYNDEDVDIDYERKRKSKYRPIKHNDDDDEDVDINYSRKKNSQYRPIEDNDDYDWNVDYTRKRNSRYKSTEINDNHNDDDVDDVNSSKTKSTGVNFNENIQESQYTEPKKGNKIREPVSKPQFTSKQDMEKLGDLIKSWISSAVPNLNDEELIKTMIKELVTSVVDGKKDLQKNDFSLSNQDEIKNLCNKIADWLTKYVDEEDLPTTVEVKDLTNKIHEISQIRESHEDMELPDHLDMNDVVDKWVNSLPLSIMDSSEQLNLEDIKNELKNKINLMGQKNESGLRNEIKKIFANIPLKLDSSGENENFLNEKVDQLIDGLKSTALIPETCVKAIVDEWAKSCKLSKSNDITSEDILKKAKTDLVKTLTNDVLNATQMTPKKLDGIFQDATQHFFRQIPSHRFNKDDINIAATKLENMFKIHSEKYPSVFPEPDRRKAADLLLCDIEQWVQNLPIETNSPEGKKESQTVKQQTLTKLIHKIGELNMNPEIYVDDFVYEDMLGDEVDNLLSNIPSESIKREHSKLKQEFLNILRRARQKLKEENAVQEYKQKLREAIEKTLPDTALSKDGEALLEVLKENTVDTFINMHYVGDDLQELTRLKNKINDEIYKFCDDQIKRCPAVPIDTRKLNETLYFALQSVSEPENDYFRNEVELIKLKDEINNWVNELPLKTRSGEDKLQTNKMISVLAKKLYDFENMKLLHSSPDQDYDDSMKKEIVQFLKKLPFTPDYSNDVDINQFSETLVKNLKDTLGLRRLNSGTRRSINFKDSCICFGAWIPPSTLSRDDQEHLEQIRNRASGLKQKILLKDVSGFPCPVDACSQTEIKTSSVGACPIRSRWLAHRNSSAQTPCKRMQAMGSQVDLSTRIWDLCDRTCVQSQGQSFVLPQDSTPCSPLRTPRHSCVRTEPISSDDFEPRVKHQSFDRVNPPCPKPFYNCVRTRALERNRNTQRPLTKEEIAKEENRCRCVTNCGNSNISRKSCHLHNVDSMNSCSKCCGVHCPYPSYLFFR